MGIFDTTVNEITTRGGRSFFAYGCLELCRRVFIALLSFYFELRKPDEKGLLIVQFYRISIAIVKFRKNSVLVQNFDHFTYLFGT